MSVESREIDDLTTAIEEATVNLRDAINAGELEKNNTLPMMTVCNLLSILTCQVARLTKAVEGLKKS